MADQLKNIYTKEKLLAVAAAISKQDTHFNVKIFLHSVFDASWEQRELKDRMHHIAATLHENLHGNYKKQIHTLLKVAPQFSGFEYMFFPDFVEQFGLDDEETSLMALEEFTKTSSAEFAIRPFIVRNQEKTLARLHQWATHSHHAVRRCASESCRPRLPWAMALPALKKDPSPILPILSALYNDESEYVRRSVANNLNDISKDHPDFMLDIIAQWIGLSEHIDKVCKHASRSLLKKGNPRALSLFNFSKNIDNIIVENFRIHDNSVKIGEATSFSCIIRSSHTKSQKIRIEYAVDYVKKNGTTSRKIFVLTEKIFQPQTEYSIVRKIALHNMTIRTHYPGTHTVTLVLNGINVTSGQFSLL